MLLILSSGGGVFVFYWRDLGINICGHVLWQLDAEGKLKNQKKKNTVLPSLGLNYSPNSFPTFPI